MIERVLNGVSHLILTGPDLFNPSGPHRSISFLIDSFTWFLSMGTGVCVRNNWLQRNTKAPSGHIVQGLCGNNPNCQHRKSERKDSKFLQY